MVLRGESKSTDIIELTERLTAEMISLCTEEGLASAQKRVQRAITSGAGYEKFLEMVRAQGGDLKVVETPGSYPKPRFVLEAKSARNGYVSKIDTFGVGMANVKLGGGRAKVGDKVDPVVGITVMKKVGEKVSAGDVLAVVRGNDDSKTKSAVEQVISSYVLSSGKPVGSKLIKERIS